MTGSGPAVSGAADPPGVTGSPGPPAGAADLLVSGSETAGRRWGRLVLAGALIMGAALAADSWQRDREADLLLDRAAAGSRAVDYADGRVLSTLRYSSPTILSARVEPRVRQSLRDLVRQEAAGQVARLRDQRAAAAEVLVLPWHGDERRAQQRWLAYLDARIAYVEEVAADFGALYRPHPELRTTLDAAGDAYRRLPDEQQRTEALFGS